ncbi:unnamed protein product, partial [Mesorhabditis spiculigera]
MKGLFAAFLAIASIVFIVPMLRNSIRSPEPEKTSVIAQDCPTIDKDVQKDVWYVPSSTVLADIERRARLIGSGCEEVWDNWLKTSEVAPPDTPPKEVPEATWNEYTLFGRIPIHKWYRNEVAKPHDKVWNDIDKQMSLTENQIFAKSTYGQSTRVVFDAMTHFRKYFEGKKGAVIGSQLPWVEVYALRHGAAHVLTVEYQKLKIQTKQPVSYIHPFDLARNWTNFSESLDFVVHFSSLEHSGLGRYGDPMDPWGDLREMAKMHCLLKPDGVMIAGFPVGDDALVWNVHRIYGPIRLQWMMLGFKLLGVFWHEGDRSVFTEGFPLRRFDPATRFSFTQPAIVLQKIST